MAQVKRSTKTDSRKKKGFNRANQKAFLEALVRRRGNVHAACDTADVSRSQVYRWLKVDTRFKKLYRQTRKVLEELLFERLCVNGENGDTTALICALKSLNRKRFDDRFALQEYMLKKGEKLPGGSVATPIHVELVCGPVPEDAGE